MALRRRISFDYGGFINTLHASGVGSPRGEGLPSSAAWSQVSSPARTPNSNAARCTIAGGSNTSATWQTVTNVGSNADARLQMQFYVEGLPDNAVRFVRWGEAVLTGTAIISAKITATGLIQLFADSTQIGSDYGPISLNKWYQLRFRNKQISAGSDIAELYIDNDLVASSTTLDARAATGVFTLGWIDNVGSGAGAKTILFDDISINDDSGASETGWPEYGERIVLLLAAADHTLNGWTGGAGGTSNVFQGVNNQPPTGDASPADADQIRSVTNSATDNYDVTCETYTSRGVSGRITAIIGVCEHGEEVSTGTKNGALDIIANPASAGETAFIYGQDVAAVGTWPQAWQTTWTDPIYAPTVDKSTGPRMRVGKRTATTRAVSCCFMGVYVAFVEEQPYAKRHGMLPFSNRPLFGRG